jgi:hypothetical protein
VSSKSASELEALQRDLAMNHPNHADDRDIDLVVAAGPADVSELVGWQPDLLPPAERRRARQMSAGMTDEQIVAHYRDRDFNPYMSMATAKALHRLHWQFRHLALAAAKAKQEALEEQRRQLRALVSAKATAQVTPESSPLSHPDRFEGKG